MVSEPVDTSQQSHYLYRSNGVFLYSDSKKVLLEDTPTAISGLTYRLLLVLISSGNQVLDSQTLAQKVWNKNFVSDETIAQRISLLRKALNDSDKTYVESLRGEGYRWIPPVISQPIISQEFETALKDKTPIFKKTALIASLACLFVAALFYLFSAQVQRNNMLETNTEPAKSLRLERAEQYAKQYNKNANNIAIKLYEQALQTEPHETRAILGLAQTLLQSVVKFNGSNEQLEKAGELSEQLLSDNPQDWQANWLRGYYFDVLGNIDKAIIHYEKSLNQNPSSEKTAGSLAYLYVRKGRLHEAMHLNIQAFSGQSRYKILQIAEILYLADLQQQAQTWLISAYNLAPDDNFAADSLASFHFNNGNTEQAEDLLLSLEQAQTATQDSYFLLSFIALNRQDIATARDYLQKALALRPTSPYSQSLLYWFDKRHNKPQMSPPKPQIETNDSGWPNLYVAQSIVEVADGQMTEAIKSLEKAKAKGFLDYQYLLISPPFEALRELKAFEQLIAQMMHSAHAERTKLQRFTLPKVNSLLSAK